MSVFSVLDPDSAPQVLERVDGPHGELVLRKAGAHYEIISNGTFLMDTRNGESERLLITHALAGRSEPASVLIGGLGVGFSLLTALADPAVAEVTVVEKLASIIDWHRGRLRVISQGAVDDRRTTVVCADLIDWLDRSEQRFDAICLDIDNGPDWTVVPENSRLYTDAGLRLLAGRLRPGGVLTVWSAAASPPFVAALERRFGDVEAIEVPVRQGKPDVVFVARRGE